MRMGVSSLLFGIGVLLPFSDAVNKNPGDVCHNPMDTCLSSECGTVMYCKENYKDCEPSSSVDHTYLLYNFVLRPGETGICYTNNDDRSECDAAKEGCLNTHCNGDTNTCESYCESDSDCYGEGLVCLIFEECDKNFNNCSSDSGTINYNPSLGSPGFCFNEVGDGDACDTIENACPTGMSCGKEGVCVETCQSDGDCELSEFCSFGPLYCDYENKCALSGDTDLNFAWIRYETIGSVGDKGVCIEDGLIGESCDDGTEGCSSDLVCKENSCAKLCNDTDPCEKSAGSDLICISHFNFCDENYQSCTHDRPSDPNANFSIRYEQPSGTEYGTCYEQVDMGDPGDNFTKPLCTDLSLVCPTLHCTDDGLCQSTCDENTSCGVDSSCLAYLEYCPDSKYQSCQFEENELYEYMKFTELRHTDQKEGLCYTKHNSYSQYCNVDHVCGDTRYCNQSITKGCDDKYLVRCSMDSDCDPFMTCVVMEECDENFKDCGGSGTSGTIHYEKYDDVNTDHANRGFCRYLNDIDEACDLNEEACISGWCDDTGVCKEHCDLGFGACGTDEICIYKIDYCDAKVEVCSDAVTTDYAQFVQVSGEQNGETCYKESGIGESCDIDVNACGADLYCDLHESVCVFICDDVNTCSNSDVCIKDILYCDDAGNCSEINAPTDAWKYAEIGLSDNGSCFTPNNPGDACDIVDQSCESWYICIDGICSNECTNDSQCSQGEQCISGISYCDANYTNCEDDWSSGLTTVIYEKGVGGCKPVSPGGGGECSDDVACESGFCEGFDGNTGTCQEGCSEAEQCPEGQQCLSSILYCDSDYKSCSANQSDVDQAIIYQLQGNGICYDISETDNCDGQNTCVSGYCDIKGVCDDFSQTCSTHSDCLNIGILDMQCYGVKYCKEDWTDCSETEDNNRVNIIYSDSAATKSCKVLNSNGSECNDIEDGCESLSCGQDGKCVSYCSDSTLCDTGECMKVEYCNSDKCEVSDFDGSDHIKYSSETLGVCLEAKVDGEVCDAYNSGCISDRCSDAPSGFCESLCDADTACPEGEGCVKKVEYCDATDVCTDSLTSSTTYLSYVTISGSDDGACFVLGHPGDECGDDHYGCADDGHCETNTYTCANRCKSSGDCPDGQSCYGDPIFCADEFMNDCADYPASDRTVIFYPSVDSDGICLPPAVDECDEFNACEDGICVSDLSSGNFSCETDNICTDDADCDPGYECYSSLEYCDAAYADCSTQQVADSGYSIIYYQEGGGRCRKANAIGVNCDNEDNACLSGKCSVDGFCDDVAVSCASDTDCATDEVCLDVLYCDEVYANCTSVHTTDPFSIKYVAASKDGGCRKEQSLGANCDDSTNACDSSWCSTYEHTCVKHCNTADGYLCDAGETCAEITYCDSTGTCSTVPSLDYHHLEYKPGDEGTCLELNEPGSDCDETHGCLDSMCSDGVCRDSCISDDDCTDGVCINYNFYCHDISWTVCDWTNAAVNPDPDAYLLTGGWYDETISVPGVCYDVVSDGSACAPDGDHCSNSSYCYDGICRLNCSYWDYCADTESCVASIGYCDANYADCSTDGSYTAGGYETLYYDIEYDGLCFANATGGTPCDDTYVCASGRCDKFGVCQTACTDNNDCLATEACFSLVEYCDEEFEICDSKQSSGLTHISFELGDTSGYCYNNGDIDEKCSISEGCESGFCDGSVCIQFARKCDSTEDCEEGLVCTSTEECDVNYETCTGGVSGKEVDTLHYSENLFDTTQDFYCRKLQDDGEECNVFQEACLSGWCGVDGRCDNYCSTVDDCVEGSSCVSSVEYCSKPGDCDTTTVSNPLKEYKLGAPGVCYADGARGDKCDDVDMGCKSLYCHGNSKCATPCENKDDCLNSGLDREVCITSIEYCDKENDDHSGFTGCSFAPNDDAFAKFYSNQGDYGICMEVKGEYRECNDYNLGCVGDHAYDDAPEYRHVCIQDSISGDQSCFVDVSTADNVSK